MSDEMKIQTKGVENIVYEKNVYELESIIYAINKQGENVLTSQSVGRLIDLLCETPLFIRAIIDNAKKQEDGLQVVLFKSADVEIVPVFTRKQYADAISSYGEATRLEPEKLMFTLAEMDEHIVINLNCENRLYIPKDVFKNDIFSGFAKKLKAKLCVKKYEEKNNILAALICRYNMETEQSEKKRIIMTILAYMEQNVAWVPCKTRFSEDDFETIQKMKPGDLLELKDARLKPDMIIHSSGKFLLPLFSQKDEAPVDYASKFSWINMRIVQYCELVKKHPACDGIIINAYTDALPIPNELIDIALNHYFGKINLINDEQMLQAVQEPNDGLQLELDDKRMYFIRVFLEHGRVRSYSIDVEAADDSHYTLEPYDAYRLSRLLEQQCHKGNFADNLKKYFTKKDDYNLTRLMQENDITFQQFHY